MAKTKEIPIEQKLQALYELQQVDSRIDKIQVMKGELPMEVTDLEDAVEGLNTRINKIETQIGEYDSEVTGHKNAKSEAETLIERYKTQLDNVKNNREFEALNKEIELQNLEVQLADKRMRDTGEKIEAQKTVLDETKGKLDEMAKELEVKKKELDKIIKETEKEEKDLQKRSDKAAGNVEDRLLKAYVRIRKAYRNGLAVVTVQRDSCGGCYAKIPPQKQLEIRQSSKVIACEHCGRILVAAPEEAEA